MKTLHLIFDLESTGFRGLPIFSSMNRIIQISAKPAFDEYKQFTSFVNPNMKEIPPLASELNHITIDMVQDAPPIELVFEMLTQHFEFHKWDSIIMIAHNGSGFDEPVLRKHLHNQIPSNVTFLDTLPILRQKFAQTMNSFTLSDVYKTLYGAELEGAHRADQDVEALRKIYVDHVLPYTEPLSPKTDLLHDGAIKYIRGYRADKIKRALNIERGTDLIKYFSNQTPGSLDAFLVNCVKIDDVASRQSIAMQVLGFERMLHEIQTSPNLEGCIDEVDYYVKYRYGLKTEPKNSYIYLQGINKLNRILMEK